MKPIQFDELCGLYLPQSPLYREPLGRLIFYHGWGSSAKRQVFRGEIFSRFGYEVVLPEANYHGKRGSLPYDDMSLFGKHFFDIVKSNIDEFSLLSKSLDETYGKASRTIVAGHSMGAYTVGGIFAKNVEVDSALLFNGSMDYLKTAELLIKLVPTSELDLSFLKAYNPAGMTIDFAKRHLFLANGKLDKTVSPSENAAYYQSLSKNNHIHFELYEETGHIISDKMLFDALNFLAQE